MFYFFNETRLFIFVGKLYGSIGRYEEAQPLLQESYERRQALYNATTSSPNYRPSFGDVMKSRQQLATILERLGRYEDTEEMLLDIARLIEQHCPDDPASQAAGGNTFIFLPSTE